MNADDAMNNDNAQPRRGDTREAQLTPHKAIAAVWGAAATREASVSETRHYNRKNNTHRQNVTGT